MSIDNNKIDRSVKFLAEVAPVKHGGRYIPTVPISTAEELKSTLVKELSVEYGCVATRLVFQSVNEAYALAALTGEPLLVLPVLAEEKVQTAAEWSARQHSLLHGGAIALAA